MTNIKVGRYSDPRSPYQGWIEDDERTWIAFIDQDGRPQFFLHRDKTGAIVRDPSQEVGGSTPPSVPYGAE